jgi:hypothetical protein
MTWVVKLLERQAHRTEQEKDGQFHLQKEK